MRVLIVDDSPVSRMLLRAVFEGEGYEVREACTGNEALQLLAEFTPDIITMDVHMPGMDGYETTERILEQHALPVVILTASVDHFASATAMRALEAGALAVLEKPLSLTALDFGERIDELLRTLRSMAQVKIVRRKRRAATAASAELPGLVTQSAACAPQLVAISASAGGPLALKAFLQKLAAMPQPWPLVLVQHIAPGFLSSFRDWLATLTPMPVLVAERGQSLSPNTLYLAPDGHHLGFAANRCVILDDGPPEEHVRPAANYLFRSVARHFGKQAIGIQMSGMGRDGAQGLAELHRTGALTLVQEPRTAVIDSMPRAAINLQAASGVLPPEGMAELLNTIAVQISMGNGSNGRK